jgi:hypothetical protein
MKKHLLFILFFLCSFNYCYCQPKSFYEESQIKKELIDSVAKLNKRLNIIENKLLVSDSVFANNLIILKKSIDSTKISTDDSRLRETIKSAENTINFQNSFVQIFEVVFGTIAFLAGFLYFFSIRPLTKQAETALDRANIATDKFDRKIDEFDEKVDEKINSRFDLLEKNLKEKEIIEIFGDIESNMQNQRRLQIERLTRGDIILDSDKIDRLFKVLDLSNLPQYEKSMLIEVLIQINSYQIQKYFALWKNVKREEIEIVNLLYRYYISGNFENFIYPLSCFILDRIDPHLEFNRLLDMLPSYPKWIFTLINCKHLIDSLNVYSRKSIIDHIEISMASWNLSELASIKVSYLFQKDLAQTNLPLLIKK